MTRSLRALAPLAAASALVLAAGTASAAPAAVNDPRGDTNGAHASRAQKRTVDIVRVTYTVTETNVVIRTHVADLARTAGSEFVESNFEVDGSGMAVLSEVGKTRVQVFDGNRLSACRGGVTTANFRTDVVRQSVPKDCFGTDEVRLTSSSNLTKDSGESIVNDAARRSGTLTLG